MPQPNPSNRLKLMAIFFSFFLPILIAYSLYFFGYGHNSHRSHGSLIHPIISTPLRKKWHILSLDIAPEDPRLSTLEKRRLALGKDQHRVGIAQTYTLTRNTHKKILPQPAYIHQLKTLKTHDKLTCFWFIVDPHGRPVLGYPQDIEPKKIDLDLRKLLKNARIG